MSDARPPVARRPGRPKGTGLPPERRRSQRYNLHLTVEEYDALCIAAIRRRTTVAKLVRERLFEGASKNQPAPSGPILGA